MGEFAVVELEANAKTPRRVHRLDCFLGCCRILNATTATCAALCMVAFGMAIVGNDVGDIPKQLKKPEVVSQQLIRIFGVVFGLLVILTETEWEQWLSSVRILDSWLGRGAFQLFVSILTFSTARAKGVEDFYKSLDLYRSIASVSLLSCSGFYLVGGLLCFGALKRARHRREVERLIVEQHLEDIERKREELKGLLQAYGKE